MDGELDAFLCNAFFFEESLMGLVGGLNSGRTILGWNAYRRYCSVVYNLQSGRSCERCEYTIVGGSPPMRAATAIGIWTQTAQPP